MKNSALIIVVVFLCLTACKKEDVNQNLYFSDTLLSQVNSGDLAVHGLVYNSDYLIHESTEPFTYKKFSYDDQHSLLKVEMAYSFSEFSCAMLPGQTVGTDPRKAAISQYSEFEYDASLRLSKKSSYAIFDGNSKLNYYYTYDYANEKIVKLSMFNAQGLLIQYNDYKYDDNGNIIRDDLYTNYSGLSLERSLIYEFDRKNNPYRVFACEGVPGIYTNRNNITSETSVYYNGINESASTTIHTYEYNSLDYPVKIDKLACIYGK
jgi:hypothetical protein